MKRLGFDLVLLGDPTSGKDTQAGLLMKKYAFLSIESGKHWRAMLRKKNKEAAWLHRTMAVGHPTPVVLMKKFLIESIKKIPKDKDLIFIGNPRLKPEAQLLVKLLKQKEHDFLVIYIRIPVKQIYLRTKKRKRLETEDSMQGIKHRLRYYKIQVSKTIDFFHKIKKLRYVNGDQSIARVAKDIGKIINDYSRSKRN